jgi:acetyl-CoA C-acetyltransferase
MESDPIVIVGSARTPLGSFQGAFSSMKATDLGAIAIKSAVTRSGLPIEDIEKVIMGCVLSGGLGQAPARQAAILAGMKQSVNCTTINKVCGSGMKTVMLAHDMLLANSCSVAVAGGLESMTNAPYVLEKARSGYRMAHGQIKDLMFMDGLEDAYSGKLMGVFAEKTVEKFNFSREELDNFALTSLSRATKARDSGYFETELEITPVTVKSKKGDPIIVKQDEELAKANPDKIRLLKPAFKENGTVTAANSSSIADGAAALVVMRASEAKKRSLKPLAKILAHSSFSHEPEWFTTAPVGAVKKLLEKLNWTVDTPDLYEFNEAFAVVTMAAMKELNISHDKVNVYGGACAIGHPLGATGARIICTLLNALTNQNKSLGIASLCIGGGEAVAIAIERWL